MCASHAPRALLYASRPRVQRIDRWARPGHPITGHTVAIFRQINKGALHINHDALEFPDGEIVLLTRLYEGQKATVLTLPTQPKTAAEAEAQQRVAYTG